VNNVASHAEEFGRRAKDGKRPIARVAMEYAEAFLGQLLREGFAFATECLENISDPELRRIVEAILFSAAAGAGLGAAIGAAVGGPGGAQVGAVVGAGLGVLAGCVAIIITVQQEQGRAGPVLVVTVR
jgi:hypothetical protein